jgi:hypothetical protein
VHKRTQSPWILAMHLTDTLHKIDELSEMFLCLKIEQQIYMCAGDGTEPCDVHRARRRRLRRHETMSLRKLIWVVTRIIGSTSRSISTDDLGDHRQVCSALGLIWFLMSSGNVEGRCCRDRHLSRRQGSTTSRWTTAGSVGGRSSTNRSTT